MSLCFLKDRKFLILLLSQLLICHIATAQQKKLLLTPDTNLVNQLNQEAPTFWSSKPDSTIILAEQALSISSTLAYTKGQMLAYRNLGLGHYEKGNYGEAVQSYKRAIALSQEMEETSFQARLHSNIAMAYLALGAHDEALVNLNEALAIAEKEKLISTLAHVHHNIGMVYHYQFKNDQAIQFYDKSLQLYESNGDTTHSTFILGNMAHLFLKKKNFKKAEALYFKSLTLAEKQQNKKAIGNALQSLGAFFMEKGNYQKALAYFFQAKEVLTSTGEQTEYLRLLDNLATCYAKLGNDILANRFATKSLDLAKKQQQLYYIQTAANQLAKLYEKKGHHKQALDYYKQAITAADSLYSQRNKEELVRMEEKYKYQKDQEQAKLIYHMQLKKQRQFLYGAVALVFVLMVTAFLLYSNIKQKHKTNRILKETNNLLEEQHVQLESSNHFKEQLISLVAHDVRHPITSLQKVLSLFENKHLSPEEIQQLMSYSHQDVNNLIHLLDDLLLWVRLQLRYTKLQKTVFLIEDVLQPICELYQKKARDKNIQLVATYDLGTKVYADEEAIATVIRNLIDNSIKFSHPGAVVHIRTTSAANNRRIKIQIIDTGIGMSEKTIKNLFTVSTYARQYGTQNEEGSGLGIQICRHYLQLNNSELFVESTFGKGTTFWFEIDTAEETTEN
ncbi:tetratricopeptide repeat-containing sensor histidine kinase [Sphingobacterium arenae]|uniref:tetratricopeptide repeat-containing sensor histidine kinase n=1 Tax=Sphingobacterium arenae TaxID=1280598 RepID=UPI001CC1C376|nr:tetratricopeptide repeat protein [Sphingobacterium arenae]